MFFLNFGPSLTGPIAGIRGVVIYVSSKLSVNEITF